LHSHDGVRAIPHAIYQHPENENLLSYNLTWETIFLDVIIMTIGLQFKDDINIASPCMMLEKVARLRTLGKLNSENLSWIYSSYLLFKNSTMPSPLSSSRCVVKKVLLAPNEIINILALDV
jgi:hypothetical protein